MHRAAYVLLACCGSTGPSPRAPSKGNIANTGPEPVVLSFRVLHVHDAESTVLEMEHLTIDGSRATLVIGSKTSATRANGGPICTTTDGGAEQCTPETTILGWQNESGATLTGTAQRNDTGFVLDFQRADRRERHLMMGCTEQWIDAAPANALVIIRPDCAWSLATERIKILACATNGETTPFAASPGIEEVDPDHETSSCGDRPMYRRVPTDGSVAQALAR